MTRPDMTDTTARTPVHTKAECDGMEPHTHAGMPLPPSCPCEPPCENPEECKFPWK